jgi:peptidoglycan/xylan/chitin deacetylase (PgdA/CDA1 family)
MSVTWRYRLAGPWLRFHGIVSAWTPTPPAAFRILNFHHTPQVQDEPLRRLLAYLLDTHGILTPAEAESRLAARSPDPEAERVPYLLTFDDGFSSQARVAARILDPLGLKGIFFLCPGLMDAPRKLHAETISRCITEGEVAPGQLPPDLAFMSWEEAAALVEVGHTLGSHTFSHRRLAGLENGDRTRELLEARQALKTRLGINADWFSYPFGDVHSIDAPSLAAVAREHRFCASGLRGLNATGTHPLGLFREEIGLAAPFAYQQLVVTGGLDLFYQRRRRRLQRMLRASGVTAGRG